MRVPYVFTFLYWAHKGFDNKSLIKEVVIPFRSNPAIRAKLEIKKFKGLQLQLPLPFQSDQLLVLH